MQSDHVYLDVREKAPDPSHKVPSTDFDLPIHPLNGNSKCANHNDYHEQEEDDDDDDVAAVIDDDNDEARCISSTQKVKPLVIDANGSNWHQSPIFAIQDREQKPMDDLPILDFDLLCATIAMQREPVLSQLDIQRDSCEAGVQRMWEGGVLDCLENKEIALRTLCCPSITFGTNLQRAGFGSCAVQGGIHFLLLFGAFVSYVLFMCAYGHLYLYLAIALFLCVAVYASYYRTQIRKRFNIKGSESEGLSSFDDGLNHLVCGCCTLCQEARTLEINNIQDGSWHGRGDTICVGGYALANTADNPESTVLKRPDVVTMSTEKVESDDRCSNDHRESRAPLMLHQEDSSFSVTL